VISSFDLALQANVPSRVNVMGEFFRLVGGVGISVTFFRSGARVGQADGMNSGFYARAKPGDVFDSVELVADSNQFAKVLIGEAEAGAASEVSVSGAVDVNVLNAPNVNVANIPRVAAHQVSLITKASVAVNTGVVYLVGAQARNFLFLQNQSTAGQDIYIGFGYNPAVGSGIKLGMGDSVVFDAVVPNDDIRALASANGGVLFGNMGL